MLNTILECCTLKDFTFEYACGLDEWALINVVARDEEEAFTKVRASLAGVKGAWTVRLL